MRTVRDLRTARNLNMREAADLSGVKIASWSDVETGKTPNPGILTCRNMARALGVSLDVFAECLTFANSDPPATLLAQSGNRS